MMKYKTARALEMAVKSAAQKSHMDTSAAIEGFYFQRLLVRIFDGGQFRVIGKMCESQGEFMATRLKLKILGEWGERSTVVKDSEKMLASLNAIGVIQRVKQGCYVHAPVGGCAVLD